MYVGMGKGGDGGRKGGELFVRDSYGFWAKAQYFVCVASQLAGWLDRGDEPRVQGFRRCHSFFIVAYIWAQPAELPW